MRASVCSVVTVYARSLVRVYVRSVMCTFVWGACALQQAALYVVSDSSDGHAMAVVGTATAIDLAFGSGRRCQTMGERARSHAKEAPPTAWPWAKYSVWPRLAGRGEILLAAPAATNKSVCAVYVKYETMVVLPAKGTLQSSSIASGAASSTAARSESTAACVSLTSEAPPTVGAGVTVNVSVDAGGAGGTVAVMPVVVVVVVFVVVVELDAAVPAYAMATATSTQQKSAQQHAAPQSQRRCSYSVGWVRLFVDSNIDARACSAVTNRGALSTRRLVSIVGFVRTLVRRRRSSDARSPPYRALH